MFTSSEHWFRSRGRLAVHKCEANDHSTRTSIPPEQSVLCNDCGRSFRRPEDLKRHKYLTERAKPISVYVCVCVLYVLCVYVYACCVRMYCVLAGIHIFARPRNPNLLVILSRGLPNDICSENSWELNYTINYSIIESC